MSTEEGEDDDVYDNVSYDDNVGTGGGRDKQPACKQHQKAGAGERR